ncbi:acyl-CoA thioesterase [Deefgea sp. CFH1-16]|uniref:acyl-CoA thioesterase n=1 Tax=Deefgea sp. CFH1-16 TaxID=2675457 RepID=UPI001FFDDAA9|nr:acyl-CoA thioesterase [Deefgea sp. CFH1-16]
MGTSITRVILEFLEEARWGLMEEYGDLSWFMAQKMALVVSRVDIRYIRAATMGDQLLIETRLAELLPREGKFISVLCVKTMAKWWPRPTLALPSFTQSKEARC